jgi:hypothetical protein
MLTVRGRLCCSVCVAASLSAVPVVCFLQLSTIRHWPRQPHTRTLARLLCCVFAVRPLLPLGCLSPCGSTAAAADTQDRRKRRARCTASEDTVRLIFVYSVCLLYGVLLSVYVVRWPTFTHRPSSSRTAMPLCTSAACASRSASASTPTAPVRADICRACDCTPAHRLPLLEYVCLFVCAAVQNCGVCQEAHSSKASGGGTEDS